MVVYWDMAALWNFALDYLLLLGTARLAGRSVRRGQLVIAAVLGAACSVGMLTLPFSPWLLLGSMLLMCNVAFAGTPRRTRLTLLFVLLACALGGAVLLLGQMSGRGEELTRSVLYARLPWGVFLTATGGAYLLLTVVFRGGARHTRGELVSARVEYEGRCVAVTLLRDTGNTLCDPATGEGVPVIEKKVLAPLFRTESGGAAACLGTVTLRAGTVRGPEELAAFRCERLTVDGRDLGARLIALSDEAFCGRYQGLWYDEEKEETERYELASTVGTDPGAA